ncbi:MAG: TMEM175 family protein [Trebonia sp.]
MTNEVTPDEPEHEEPEGFEKYEERSVERLIFFSDAVTAIAITLLALELPVPEGATVSAFWSSVRHNDGLYLAFLVSFVTVAASWSDHHDAFKHIRRADSRLRNLNMIWLLMIILVPFATKLLTGNSHDNLTVHAFRWGFYALVQVLTSAALFVMVRQMISHQLAEPGSEARDSSASDWRTYGPMLGFGLSIPVFFVTTYAWALWIAVPLLFARRFPLQRGKRPGQEHA